jgi:hypothetical protein
MLNFEEENMIKMNLDLFGFHAEKENKFKEIWSLAKQTMEEVIILSNLQKLKYQESLSEILLRCCSFLTFLYFNKDKGEEIKTNGMEKFMKIDRAKSTEHKGGNSLIFDMGNFKSNQPRLLNLHDFFKSIKKIVRQNYENDKEFEILNELLKDFSFSDTLYKKCEEIMNLFFDNQ